MSVASEITRLQTAKADLKTAIEGKGVTVSSSAKLDAYPALVESISGGSIEDLITKAKLVRIETRMADAVMTLDASNNFTANDVFLTELRVNYAVFTFEDFTLHFLGGAENIFFIDNNKHVLVAINDINIEVQKYSRSIIYFYLNNEIIGTINYED